MSVVATTAMVADLVRNVAGERAEVTSLMGTGVDPHLYKASAGDVDRLADADMIFYNGLHLEGKIADVLGRLRSRGKVTVGVAERIDGSLLVSPEEYDGYYDPHVWFDVSLWKIAAEAVRDGAFAPRSEKRRAVLPKRRGVHTEARPAPPLREGEGGVASP